MEITLNVTLLTALFALLLTGGIFLFAFQAFLLRGVNAMLDSKTEPLKENQVRMEKDLNQLEKDINQLKESHIRMESELNQFKVEVNVKLDKLLSK